MQDLTRGRDMVHTLSDRILKEDKERSTLQKRDNRSRGLMCSAALKFDQMKNIYSSYCTNNKFFNNLQ